jgi:hypothetical protein
MQDDEIRELFHRMELRFEHLDGRMDRLDTRIDNLEKAVADVRAEFRGRFEVIENRLNSKAGNWVVTFWGATLAMLIGPAFALTKWL